MPVPRHCVLLGVVLLTAVSGARGSAAKLPVTRGLALWLRADAGVATAPGTDRVTRWADQTAAGSGIGDKTSQDAVAPSDAARPRLVKGALNGRPVVRFDGRDDRLGFKLPIDGLEQLTLFMVAANTAAQDPAWAAHHHLALGWTYTGGWGIYGLSPFQGAVAARFATATCFGAAVYVRPSSVGSSFSITASRKNGTHHALFVNGQRVYSCILGTPTVRNTSDSGSVGGGIFGAQHPAGYYQGDIAEVLVYTTALSDAERRAVERHLRDRWFRPPLPQPVRQPIRKPTGQWAGWWRFDGDLQDASGKGNHAVRPAGRANDARIVTDPARGQVLQLDGDGDYLAVRNAPSLDLNSSFTLALWVKLARPLAAQRPWAGIVGKHSAHHSQFAILVDGYSGVDFFQGEFYYGDYPNVHYVRTSKLVPNTRDWYHVAMVFDDPADTLTLYVNGKPNGRISNATHNPVTTGGQLELGRYPGREGQHFAGRLDDVRLYDRALTQDRVEALAKPGAAPAR